MDANIMNRKQLYSLFLFGYIFLFAKDLKSAANLPVEEKNEAVDIEDELKIIKQEAKPDAKDDKVIYTFAKGKSKVGFSVKIRPEAFYSRSLQLFSPSKLDQVVYAQTTFDFKTDANLEGGIKSLVNLRHKSIWGNPNTIARTTKSSVKVTDAVVGDHVHFLGKQVVWMREGWIDLFLNKTFCFESCNNHYLTLGAFSFKLGRGIALGDAYAVSPGLLGFYSNNVVDQYAYGILSHGDVVKDQITYDIYLSILEDLSDNFEDVNEKIYEMQVGKTKTSRAARGFGKLNYVLASRLLINLLNPERFSGQKMVFEPYILYNRNPEQDVEFPSDASSKLVTLGFGLEYASSKLEFGFEYAQNFGAQHVRPWDRNRIETLRNGTTAAWTDVYSDIRTEDPVMNPGAPRAPVTDANRKIVNASNPKSDKCNEFVELNGKQISFAPNPVLFNDINRFRAGYDNTYSGFMFVTDASYKLKNDLKIAGTFAIASGDEDPNVDLDEPLDSEVDGVYSGFIGLQEIYSGKRVTSLFVLNKAIPRPLSVPSNDIPEEDPFAQNVFGFTDLVYFGLGLDWTPTWCQKQFSIKPAVLAYWLEDAAKKFDRTTGRTINQPASKFLGTEINTWFEVKLLNNLKGFIVGGVFFPGTYFDDVKGKPLNRAQRAILDSANNTGVVDNNFPLLGTHYSVILNWGFEYLF